MGAYEIYIIVASSVVILVFGAIAGLKIIEKIRDRKAKKEFEAEKRKLKAGT